MAMKKIVNTNNAEELKEWGQELLLLSLSDAVAEIGFLINTLKDQLTDKEAFLNAIEIVRPFIHQLNPIVKEQTNEDDARAYIELLELEIAAYEHVLETPEELPSHVLITALHRSLINKIQDQITHYRYYFLIPERKWLRIHRLFYIAIKKKLLNAF
jgi:hypothetical protein